MDKRFVLSAYIEEAMARAVYDKLDDNTFAGHIPVCRGVVAFGGTLRECEQELRSVLEDWILVGFKLKHRLPVFAGIDLNGEPGREPLVALQVA
jgi:predicted RNase H-like HicB family nuclease